MNRAAIPLAWEDNGIVVTVAVSGDAKKVAAVLRQLPTLIDPTKPPSEWIQPLADLIRASTARKRSSVMWNGIERGVLAIERTGVVEQKMLIPDALMQRLLSIGKFKTGDFQHAAGSSVAPVTNQ